MSDYDYRKIGVIACIALVVVRLALGWQLLYEGLWKLDSQKTSSPWTAEPYLKNATGPLREHFRNMTGDPNDLKYLDYDTIEARWKGWAQQFAAHYGLDERQQRQLLESVVGREDFRVELEQLPEGVDLGGSLGKVIRFVPEEKRLIIDGKEHLTPKEKQTLLKQVGFDEATMQPEDLQDPVKINFVKALLSLYKSQSNLSFLEQARATLQGDPEMAGSVDERQQGTLDGQRLGKIEIYRNRLARYEQNLAKAKTHFDHDHLNYDWKEIQGLRSELITPIKGLEADMKWKAEKLLSTDQMARGPLPQPMTSQRDIDLKTMWALTIIGGLLLAGLATRIAALAGAFLLFNFYMAYPPFPGYPEPPGVEHAIIVNKVFIEVLMLLTFVFLPSGRWFGIDAIFARIFMRNQPDDRY
ncbi:MAG: hypothetical protein KDA78_03145 [Planctomycetaceae bacterium]|nr:hypothetical protein [Planctomycetaceae bacterium]